MLLKNNKSCFCCWKLLILSKGEKNRRHKWKLSVPGRGGQKFRQKFLSEGPPPICCQFVILLKSLPWQHMWRSKSFLTFCPKSRFLDFFTFKSRFSTESSTEAPAAIIDAESNIASLLPIFNKIVVFRQQMLIFQHFPLSFMRKSKKWWKNNICCRKSTILLKISNNDAMLRSASFIASGAP